MSRGLTPPVEHPMLAAQRVVLAALDRLAETDGWSLCDGDVGAVLDNHAVLEARLAAVKLAVVAEADARGLGVSAATTTAGWLRSRLLLHPGEARRTVRLASALRSDCRATGAALAAGALSAAHAQTIAEVLDHLPPLDPDTRCRAEAFLIDQATMLDPLLLGQAGRALTETLTSTPDADGRAARQQQRRELHRIVAPDGMVRYTGWFDPEADATIFAALGPLSAPRPATDGTPDPRSAAQRRADGMVDMARIALATGDLPDSGGTRPTVVVTIDLAALTAQIGAARLPTGEPISPAAARRIGCDAKIIPMILGGPSQPLDVGRAARTVPAPMHAALVLRDQACAFPACDRLAAWCQDHHIRHWVDGGATALSDLVLLLCHDHHTSVHHHGWTIRLEDDGLPTFHPPPWIDPTRTPRRHHRYQLRQLGHHLDGHDTPD